MHIKGTPPEKPPGEFKGTHTQPGASRISQISGDAVSLKGGKTFKATRGSWKMRRKRLYRRKKPGVRRLMSMKTFLSSTE